MEYLTKFVRSPETRRLLVTLVVFFGLPTLVFGAIGAYATRTIRAEFESELQLTAARAADTVDRNLFERYGDVQAFGLNSAVLVRDDWYKGGTENRLVHRINQYIDTYDLYYLAVFVDTEGKVVAVNDRDSDGNPIDTSSIYGMNLASSEWFQALKSGKFTQKRPFTAPGNDVSSGTYVEDVAKDRLVSAVYHNVDGLSIGFSAPVFGEKGEVIGYWTNRAKFSLVDQILRATRARLVALGRTEASVTLLAADGTLLVRQDPADKDGKYGDVASAHVVAPFSENYARAGNKLVEAAKMNPTGVGEFVDQNGEEHIGGYAHLVGALGYPGMDWFVLVSVPRANPGSSFLKIERVSNVATWGLILLAIPVAFWLLRRTLNAELVRAELEAKQVEASRAVNLVQHALTELASGNTNALITESFEGELEEMKENVNRIALVLTQFNAELSKLALAARNGDLTSRADSGKFTGGYAEVIEGVNDIVDAILTPVNAIRGSLGRVAGGDLTAYITERYSGDHAALVDSLNSSLDGLNRLLGQVRAASDQISTGSSQVASAAQDLSQGASEQAATIEEISAQMGQMTSQTSQNAENAAQANQLAIAARDGARAGDVRMNEMLGAMREIEEASNNISKIIKVIDEIAFQTNLLALNAAVEAARAGVHGKGFAVVAEEVRNLAARSARAAKETTSMIEGSIAKVSLGTNIARETASALGAIVQHVGKVTDLVAEIAAASSEQADGINQINSGLDQVNQVTQRNTATAEESAASAEETSGQVAEMQRMLSRFTLREGAGHGGMSENISPEMMSMVQSYVERILGGRGPQPASPVHSPSPSPRKSSPRMNPSSIISLDSGDFGKY